ncbi:hypothetical protein F4680DRAFT_449144 [Xylaria scruposa]|nr:hypothetical protein F4680DRAFT_449144 [Xylaria scruposa]
MPPTPTSSTRSEGTGSTNPGNSSGGLSTDNIIGIAVGVPSAVLALIGVIIAYFTLRKDRKNKKTKVRLNSVGEGSRIFNVEGMVGHLVAGDHHGDHIRSDTITKGNIGTLNLNRG